MNSVFRSLKSLLVLCALPLAACVADDGIDSNSDDIVDVQHTDVERQSIGNCWLYAEASWVESMHLAATGEAFDSSQSYWTYWHWRDQIVNEGVDEIETGGFYSEANQIILDRGLLTEAKFVKEDTAAEMSSRQADALSRLNQELRSGRLSSREARRDGATVRKVMDEAWKLKPSVKGQLTKAFGKDGSRTLRDGGTTYGTSILAATEFEVAYTERRSNPDSPVLVETTLDQAIYDWQTARYPSWSASSRRDFQIRVQHALHDRQPVIVTWNVDFNAMESSDPVTRGSFNLATLDKAGIAGNQGGHMTVMEDYEVETEEFGLLAAGVTLDPQNPDDQAKLEAALLPSSTMRFIRIKNSWGALRDDRSSAPGFPGYHDLYLDYLNGPIAWCPDADDKTQCSGSVTPLREVTLPPGY